MKVTAGFFSVFVAVGFFLSFPSPLAAQYAVQVSAPTLIIDKFVARPSGQTKGDSVSLEYVDNLGTADFKFKPGDEVSFQLKVKNATNQKLESVTIEDFLPPSLEPLEGPGSYDDKNRVITIDAGSFNVGEEKFYFIKMRVIPQERLPADKGLLCEINKAVAKSGAITDDDVAQFCIEKEVLKVVKVPAAGPEMGMLMLAGNGGLLMVGIYIALQSKKLLDK